MENEETFGVYKWFFQGHLAGEKWRLDAHPGLRASSDSLNHYIPLLHLNKDNAEAAFKLNPVRKPSQSWSHSHS